MKRLCFKFSLLTLGIISYLSSASQTHFNKARTYFDDQVKDIDSNPTTLLMSYPALNVFMAQKVNSYLTGSGDLALNKAYFILDQTDGRLFLGANIAQDPSLGQKRTKWVFTLGLKANANDAGLATVYDGNKGNFSENIGGSFKITFLNKGSVHFDSKNRQVPKELNLQLYGLDARTKPNYKQSELSKFYRKQLRNELQQQITQDSTVFEESIKNVSDEVYRALKRQKFADDKIEEYKSKYIVKEAEFIDKQKNYNLAVNSWFSLDFYLPFTNKEYDIAKDFMSIVETKKLYNFEGTLFYNTLFERKKSRYLTSISIGAKNLSNIILDEMEKKNISDYRYLGGTLDSIKTADTIKLGQMKNKDIYIGDYKTFFVPFVKFHFVSFFIYKKSIGLSIMLEKHLSNDYDPLNLRLGIPFNLRGKDEETKVNFELQFKWNDFNNSILPDKTRAEKFIVGLNVGVPLTSKIY